MHAEIHSYTDICTYIQYADTHTFTYMHGCIHAETKNAGDDAFGDLLLTGLLSVENDHAANCVHPVNRRACRTYLRCVVRERESKAKRDR